MTQHSPDRIHWAKVLKLVTDSSTKTLSVKSIARTLGVDFLSDPLQDAISQLLIQGKIRKCMGRDEATSSPSIVLVLIIPDIPRGHR